VLTKDDLEAERGRRGPSIGTQQIVDEWIRFQATLIKAQAAGYDRDPELRAQWERFLVSRFQEDALAKREKAALEITESELRDHYKEHAEDFRIPEAVRLSVLFVQSARQATAAKRQELAGEVEALQLKAATMDATGFGELIRLRSEDQSTRYRDGDVGWLVDGVTETHWEPPVLKAAYKLRHPGDLSPVVETDKGFYIIRLREHRPSNLLPFDEVKDRLRHLLTQRRLREQQDQFTREMRAGLDIRVNQPLINSLTPQAVATEPSAPPLPGG
jgi:peptidyl-prolyl cis-trans isomerase C